MNAKYPAGCYGKIGYPTRDEAMGALGSIRKRKRVSEARDLSAYHCKHCGAFHLGRRGYRAQPQIRRTPDHERNSLKNRKARYWELIGQ